LKITTGSVEDVKVITLDQDVKTIDQAVQYINELSSQGELNTIRIFQLAYTKFPDFDGFVSYSSKKRCFSDLDAATPTIHGFQCKLSRGYPRHEVNNNHIAKNWFLRGGATVKTSDSGGWTFPTVEYIRENLLGYGLRLLHPMDWGTVPLIDPFD
jgi:hypothetical protein